MIYIQTNYCVNNIHMQISTMFEKRSKNVMNFSLLTKNISLLYVFAICFGPLSSYDQNISDP